MRKVVVAFTAAALAIPSMSAPAFGHDGYYRGRIWQDSHGRYRCKRPDGTVGLIVGGAAGALIGRAIDTHGERATGTIFGAAAGALIGRKIDRSRVKCK